MRQQLELQSATADKGMVPCRAFQPTCLRTSQRLEEAHLDSCPLSIRGPAKLQRAKLLPTTARGSVLRQAGLLARTCMTAASRLTN